MREFLSDLWDFMRVRKKLWLLPVLIVFALLGGLVVASQQSALVSFIYTLFEPGLIAASFPGRSQSKWPHSPTRLGMLLRVNSSASDLQEPGTSRRATVRRARLLYNFWTFTGHRIGAPDASAQRLIFCDAPCKSGLRSKKTTPWRWFVGE